MWVWLAGCLACEWLKTLIKWTDLSTDRPTNHPTQPRYVSPVVAHDIVQRHLVKGELIPGVWRGQMGLTEDEQKSRCENCACEKTEL